jgi:hypothetical protein
MKKEFRLTAIFCAGILLFLTAGCRKDDPENAAVPATPAPQQYFTKFKVDGVQQEYFASENLCLFNQFDPVQGQGSVSFVAKQNSDSGGWNHIWLQIHDSIPISLNTYYTNYSITQSNHRSLTNGEFSFSYWDNNRHYTFTMDESLTSSIGLLSDAKLILTEVTSDHVKGRFSGSVYDVTYTNVIHEITDGEFFLPRL